MNSTLPILDPSCGSRMFYFDKNDDRVLFGDVRQETHVLCDGRELFVMPDVLTDFRELQFEDESFQMVIFDPPHLKYAGQDSWLRKKYGVLSDDWKDDLRRGFSECFRVLKTGGTLCFKWNETQIKTAEILKLTNEKPVIGHLSGKRSNTHWILFLKGANT